MNRAMAAAKDRLEELLESTPLTAGMYVRVHGDNLVMGRHETNPDAHSEPDPIDLVRLTRLSQTTYGLSVKRHTGRWEKTPFQGTMKETVGCMCEFMQHLIAPL